MQESRTQKTLLNAKINLIYIFISVFIAFFSRKIFIDCLGAEFLGLTSTLQSILGFLNLAELGIGGAIAVNLYKPIAQKDHHAINEIVSVMAFFYQRIGSFILIGGVILSLFLPLIFEKAEISMGIVFFAYYAFLIPSIFTYFFTYKSVLLSADQRQYEITKYTQIANVIKLVVQIVAAYYTKSPYLWVLIELIFGSYYCYLIITRIGKIYPWFSTSAEGGKGKLSKYPHIKKNIQQIFIHKIAGFITDQLTPMVIYGYLSLTVVLFYTNYKTVIQKLSLFINAILGSADASVGNLIADKSVQDQLKVYDEMTSLRFFIAGLYVFMLYWLINPFIGLWLGKEYLFGMTTVTILLFDVFINQYRGATDQFLSGYALFKDVWASYVEGIIFLGGSILLAPHYGINGIIFPLMLSKYIIAGIWKPYFLFKEGFKVSIIYYIKLWINEVGVLAISYLIATLIIKLLPLRMANFVQWTVSASVIGVIYLSINITLMYFFAPQFKFTIKRLKMILEQKILKRK